MSNDSSTRTCMEQSDAIKSQADNVLALAIRRRESPKVIADIITRAFALDFTPPKYSPCNCDVCRGELESDLEDSANA